MNWFCKKSNLWFLNKKYQIIIAKSIPVFITCIDEQGKDQGVNVRNKVKEIISLVQDNERLREERKRAKKNRDKYVGMSSEDARFQTGRYSKCYCFCDLPCIATHNFHYETC